MKRLEEISPIDGRYYKYTESLKEYFSEYAYLKYRFNIEIDWLEELNKIINIVEHKKSQKQLPRKQFLNTRPSISQVLAYS